MFPKDSRPRYITFVCCSYSIFQYHANKTTCQNPIIFHPQLSSFFNCVSSSVLTTSRCPACRDPWKLNLFKTECSLGGCSVNHVTIFTQTDIFILDIFLLSDWLDCCHHLVIAIYESLCRTSGADSDTCRKIHSESLLILSPYFTLLTCSVTWLFFGASTLWNNICNFHTYMLNSMCRSSSFLSVK